MATLPTDGCLFAVAPDVFDPAAGRGDPVARWERSEPEFETIRSCGLPAALVAQDGVEDMDLDWDAFDVLEALAVRCGRALRCPPRRRLRYSTR